MSTADYPFPHAESSHLPHPISPPSPRTIASDSCYALDPLDMARPPFPDDSARGAGSPDSNDQDQEVFVTPANSARPSMIEPMFGGESTGLGIGLGAGREFPSEHYYIGEEPEVKATYSKPMLNRSTSVESNLQTRRAAGNNQAGWQTVNTASLTLATTDRGPSSDDSSGQSTARSPITSSSSAVPGQPQVRERVTSPKRLADQQRSYLPNHLQINPPSSSAQYSSEPSPAADGKKEPSVRPLLFSTPSNPDTRPRNVRNPYNAPVNIPTGHEFVGPRIWQPDPRSRTVSGGEKGFALSAGPEKAKFTDSQAYWLGLYFMFNLGLTLFNKFVLVSFPFPYTLTGLHALSGCIGCYVALERGAFTPARLTRRENLILFAFSILYTINIAVSNISLQLVTVPVVRASTPFFTILTSALLLGTRFTLAKLVALLPVVAGVGFATYGDYYFTAWGLILTLLGTFLAALKTVATNLIQTGGGGRLKLHPLDLLMRMSPLAFVQCVIYGWYTGELERVRHYGATQMTQTKAIALLVNGVIACGLNIVSFTANKKSGPLTMTVSANCKQVMTIALAVVLFDLHISITNAIGILLTLVGGATYGLVEYREKQRRAAKMERA